MAELGLELNLLDSKASALNRSESQWRGQGNTEQEGRQSLGRVGHGGAEGRKPSRAPEKARGAWLAGSVSGARNS